MFRSRFGAREALFSAFFLSGFFMATWITRTPAIREGLGLTLAEMGLVLFGLSMGSLPGLFVAAPLVHRFGPKPLIIAGELLTVTGILTAGTPFFFDFGGIGPFVCAAGLAQVGFGSVFLDIALNVAGAAIEVRSGRPVLTSLHGFFSFGEAIGAFFGFGAVAFGVAPMEHFLIVALLMLIPFALSLTRMAEITRLVEESSEKAAPKEKTEGKSSSGSVVTGALLAAAAAVFAVALCEGSANDWLPILLRETVGATTTFSALAFAIFAACLAAVRFTGTFWLRRFGRGTVLRASAVIALVGLAIVITMSWAPAVILGVVLWSAGAALGFPVALSAGAAMEGAGDPAKKMSILSSAGYAAFLAGPPTLGFIGEHAGLPAALAVAALFLLFPIALAGRMTRKTPGAVHTAVTPEH